jgi:hypothetical protein
MMADIESMFYQVKVNAEDTDMLRYLWWPAGDLSKDPVEYRMLVHLFGAVSSPSSANYALKKTAKDNEHKYDKEIIDTVNKDFYVDDLLKSVPTEEESIKQAHDLIDIMEEGGFKLTKWMSSSKRMLETIPVNDRAKEVKNLDLNMDALPIGRALGVQWSAETDQLLFSQHEVNPKATKRNILSVMSSIYDPFGITAPFVLKAKIILQALCRHKITWDDPIPEDQKKIWEKWLQEVPKLENIKLDRCYKPPDFRRVTDTQLHHFCDASQDGYGTVTYLRLTNEKDQVHCAFVTGKARVAPLKAHTIVKLELTAATLAVRQDNMIKREINMDIDSTTFWTDSETVLKYIKNESARHPVFVANRIAIISDGSDVSQWKYVPSKLNPADHASRGLIANELMTKGEWLYGPEFLSQPKED